MESDLASSLLNVHNVLHSRFKNHTKLQMSTELSHVGNLNLDLLASPAKQSCTYRIKFSLITV